MKIKFCSLIIIVMMFSSCHLFGDVFDGGKGTASDPYQLRTPKDMQNMKKYPSAYFKMVADIDMDSVSWIPFEMSGSFDGCGHTIYNLKISAYVQSDYQGLFSKLSNSASVMNLTIDGIEINAPSYSYIGAIAGECLCSISNCYVVLRQSNAIIGNEKVGGIVGSASGLIWYGATANHVSANITNCSVSSNLTSSVIIGNSQIGGIVGSGGNIYDSRVHCNISCGVGNDNESVCGGIAGAAGKISQCSYDGTLSGLANGCKYIGGIAGRATEIFASKSNVTISVKNGYYLGGIVGGYGLGSGWNNPIVACYSQGNITGSAGATFAGSIYGVNSSSCQQYDCYSLMNLQSDVSAPSFSISNLVNQFPSPINIAEIMRASNLEAASYWNYDRTWTWTGIVNGQSVTAICPKLAWE